MAPATDCCVCRPGARLRCRSYSFRLLLNALDAAEQQIVYALDLIGEDFTKSSLLNERLRDIQNMRAEMDRE